MTDPDRGAYTPQTDAPLAFDARQSRRDGGGRSPVALIVSGFVLAVLIAAVVVFYRGGVRGVDEAPQPVGAPIGSIKTIAPAQPKPADETASLEIYKSDEPAAVTGPAFAPPPEQPLPRPAPRPTFKVESGDIPPAVPASAVAPKPVPPKPVPPAAAVKPAVSQPAPVPAPVAAGGAVVQIGAFSSDALAAKGWSDVAAAHPGDMGGKGRRIEAVPGSTLKRSLITGFATRDAAAAFCAKLKAGGGSCIVK